MDAEYSCCGGEDTLEGPGLPAIARCDEYWQDGDPTGNLRGTCNDAMDDLNRTDYDWVFDGNMEWVIERATVDSTTDVSADNTALLGLG